jgi:hypothetical protein
LEEEAKRIFGIGEELEEFDPIWFLNVLELLENLEGKVVAISCEL